MLVGEVWIFQDDRGETTFSIISPVMEVGERTVFSIQKITIIDRTPTL